MKESAITIDANGLHYRDLNFRLKEMVSAGSQHIELRNVYGQRYIGTNLNGAAEIHIHGTPGNEIGNENYEHIKKLYPDDKAINYTVGELRGIWSISFNKQQLLNGIGSE